MMNFNLFIVLLLSCCLCMVATRSGLLDVKGNGTIHRGFCNKNNDCMNGGTCDSLTGVCVCRQGFRNDLTHGIMNCSLIDCANNGTAKPGGGCNCAEGWSGENCIMCSSNIGCQHVFNTTNTTAVCDTSYVTYKEKRFSCSIHSEELEPLIGNYILIQCNNVPVNETAKTRGHCDMQVFDVPGVLETFYCHMEGCYSIFGPGEKVTYKCATTSCNCSNINPKCSNEYVIFILQGMQGWATVECEDQRTKECAITQQEFPGLIPIKCNGAECIPHPVPPPEPEKPDYLFLYIGIGLGAGLGAIILFALLFSSITSIYQTHVIKEEERVYRDEVKGASLEIRNLSYTMKVLEKGKYVQKVLLHNINHTIRPGSVVAIMGPSGAGKTTLLDIIANRNKVGTITGQILMNGKPIGPDYGRLSGYVFQDDLLMSTLTVRECISFSANLRLPDTITRREKEERVQRTMEELGIAHIADRKIGDVMDRGISGGEKRRVSIAMELVISPHILFLDEPTSGLDSASAYSVMKTITDLSKKGRTVVFSIHQPRSNIYATFHDVILLDRGKIAYAGPAEEAVDYFSHQGFECPPHFNPADFLIDVLTMLDQQEATKMNPFIDTVQENTIIQAPYRTNHVITYPSIPSGETISLLTGATNANITRHPYATSFYSQLWTLSGRSFTNFYRNFYLMPAHYLSAIIMGLGLGAVYWHLGIDIAACQNRLGVMFFMCCILCFSAMSSLELFITERAIFVRERANKYYRPLAYFMSKTLFDMIPLRLVPPLIMGSIAYYMIGLRHDEIYHFILFIGILTLFNLVSGSLCITIGSIAPSVASGNVIATIIILANALFSGMLLNNGTIPVYLNWLRYLSFWFYAFESLVINEFHGITVIINPKGMPSYPGPGDFWLRELYMDPSRLFYDVIILGSFVIGFMILSCILLLGFVKEKR